MHSLTASALIVGVVAVSLLAVLMTLALRSLRPRPETEAAAAVIQAADEPPRPVAVSGRGAGPGRMAVSQRTRPARRRASRASRPDGLLPPDATVTFAAERAAADVNDVFTSLD